MHRYRRHLCGAGLWLLVASFAVPAEQSVAPGANRHYLAPRVDVDAWVGRFETESREVHAERDAIVAALGITPGMRVADVGAGTGLFVPLLAAAVGATGQVWALDIAPAFVAHLRERVAASGLRNVQVVQSTADAVALAPASIDLAFLCNVYHHLEYPHGMLASLYAALAPGGRLAVVDFARIEGVSPRWILGHVRAGRATVAAEIGAAGFVPLDPPPLPALEDNYLLLFARP
ncbi:MAG: methyltransferase domain-containing protein [Gammaproteobacteria bacterium]